MKRYNKAFTVVELLIGVSLMVLVMLVIYRLQSSSSRVYMISAWKQEHSRKLQYLIKLLKDDLGEASRRIQVVAGDPLPTIDDCPLSYNSNGLGPELLEFTRNHFNDDGSIEYQILCSLILKNRKLTYSRTKIAGNPPDYKLLPQSVELTDVDRVEVEAKTVVYSKKTGYEYVLEGAIDPSDEEVSGAMLNMSFILRPPANVSIKRPLVETLKKNLYVKAQPF